MAVKNYEKLKETVPSKLTMNDELPPNGRYVMRCIEEVFSISKSSENPMITRTWEVVSPEEIKIGDKLVGLAGEKFRQYLTTKVIASEKNTFSLAEVAKKSDAAYKRWMDENAKVGLPTEGFDDENPDMQESRSCIGVVADCSLYTKKEPAFNKTETGELKPRLLENGQQATINRHQFGFVYGLSSVELNLPF